MHMHLPAAACCLPAAAAMSVEDKDKVLVLVVRGKVKPGRVEEFKAIWKPLVGAFGGHWANCAPRQL